MTNDEPDNARIREASPDEDRLIRYLSRIAGQTLMGAWHNLPPEMKEGLDMSLAVCSALTHNLGQMLAAAPKEGIPVDDPRWQQFVETTIEMVRRNAIDARERVLAGDRAAQTGEAAAAPRLPISQPKFVM